MMSQAPAIIVNTACITTVDDINPALPLVRNIP